MGPRRRLLRPRTARAGSRSDRPGRCRVLARRVLADARSVDGRQPLSRRLRLEPARRARRRPDRIGHAPGGRSRTNERTDQRDRPDVRRIFGRHRSAGSPLDLFAYPKRPPGERSPCIPDRRRHGHCHGRAGNRDFARIPRGFRHGRRVLANGLCRLLPGRVYPQSGLPGDPDGQRHRPEHPPGDRRRPGRVGSQWTAGHAPIRPLRPPVQGFDRPATLARPSRHLWGTGSVHQLPSLR